MPIERATDIIPSVTTNGGMPTTAMRKPLRKPTNSEAAMANGKATGSGNPELISTLVTMAETSTVEPTDRSMPPVMITAVMPMAMMPTKAKLRVTLKRLPGVAKVLVKRLRAMQARNAAISTQNTWRLISPAMKLRLTCWSMISLSELSALMNFSLYPLDGSGDEAGDFFRRAIRDALV